MDRFFVKKQNINLDTNSCIIEGEDVKHISKVLRCKIGEKLEVCDNDNNEYVCEITDIDKSFINLNIRITSDKFTGVFGRANYS